MDTARWTQRDGLPQSTITGIAPTGDGTLWLATFGGLARFDGQRAVPVQPAPEILARVSRLSALAVDGADPHRLLLGSVDNGLWSFDGERFTRVPQPAALEQAAVYSIAQHAGRLEVATNRGPFARDADGTWTRLSDETAFGIALAPDGDRFVCGLRGTYWLTDGGTRVDGQLPRPAADEDVCLGAVADPEGGWWMQSRAGFWRIDAEGRPTPVPGLTLDARWGQHPVLDAEGHLWAADATGAWDLGPWHAVAEATAAGTPSTARLHTVGAPRAWHAGPSGALWIGTMGEGLVHLRPQGFARLDDTPPPGSRGTGPLSGGGDAVWYTVDCDDLQRRGADGTRSEVPLPPPAEGGRSCIDALWATPERVFVARGSTLLSGTAARVHEVADLPDRGTNGAVAYLEGHGGGGVWVGTEHGGLWRFDGEHMRPHPTQPPADQGVILDVLERRDGTLALGRSRGICLEEEGGWRCLDESDGLVPGAIRHLAEDAEGRLWLASYGGGLGWLDDAGAGAVRSGDDGIPDRFLSAVLLDPQGTAWLQGNAGLTRVRVDDLLASRADPGRPLRTELIPVGEANGWLRQSAALLDNGDLWLAGVDAITVVHTAETAQSEEAPPPQLRSAALGDAALAPGGPNTAPPDAFRRLEVHYSAPALDGGADTWFEHRLLREGQDAEWVEVGSARSAVYPGLAPGAYRFEVRGVGLDGRRGPTAALTFAIAPFWWERPWVPPALVLALLGLVATALSLRNRAAVRRNRELQAEIERREQAEQALAEREARFRQVFDRAVNGFLLHAEDGTCIAANPTACALFGRAHADLLATPADALGLRPVSTATGGGAEPVLCTRADGTGFPARVDRVRYEGRQGPLVLTSIVDLTALVEAQEQEQVLRRRLSQAERLEALGRLSGGVAHNMNNALAAIANNLDLLAEMVPTHAEEAHTCLAEARAGVEGGVEQVQQLLAFSGRREAGEADLDPADLVATMAETLRPVLPPDRQLEVVSRACGRVRMSRTALEQVVLHLVMNASDAMPGGGRIRVGVGPVAGEAAAMLEVRDDGSGIEDDVLEHIFEPFFTTKGLTGGSGLGLSTVKGTVEAAGGSIEVRTGPAGTTFTVTLPSVPTAPTAPTPEARPAPRPPQGRILLVDDDARVRRSVRMQLERGGWSVDDHGDPVEALAHLRAAAAPPALLLTDVMMPAMNGRQLAEAARETHPGLRVLYISGYTADVLGDDIEGPDSLLSKPFSRDALLRAVAERIEG